VTDFNGPIIAEFRANGGVVTEAAPFGSNLVLLHSTGAKTGADRVHPLMSFADPAGWLIVASKAGAPSDPVWAHNLRANPQASVEASDDGTIVTVDVTASEVPEPERSQLWEQVVAAAPGFGDYQVNAGDRIIPIFRLTRT
jgi:deazaflavin-dependent oxidoreductase (nitroreductase family)